MVKLHLLGAMVLMAIGMFSCQKQQIISDAGGGGDDEGSISLVADPDKIFIGESVDLIATVLDEDGDPVSGETVHFEVDSDNNGHDGTDSNGKAHSSWTAPPDSEEPHTHTAKASVNGDYDPDTATASFTVVPGKIILEVKQNGEDVEVVPSGETVQLHARLKPAPGTNINNVSISFNAKVWNEDTEEWDHAGGGWPKSGITGDDVPQDEEDGEAIISTSLSAEKYQFTATWNNEEDTDEAAGVGVDRIIVKDSDPEDEGPAYFPIDSGIVLKAIPIPADVAFPEGYPEWEFLDKPEGSNVNHPADGSATTKLEVDILGEYSVKASCGDNDDEFTAIAFKLNKIILYGRSEPNPIIRAEEKDRFWFQGGEQIMFRAEIEPNTPAVHNALNDKFKWSLEEIPGIPENKKKPIPDWGDGKHAKGVGNQNNHVKFSLEVLPANNQGFGEKELKLEVVGFDTTKEAQPRLFFARTAKTHPDPDKGETANWYHYWSKEGDPGVCMFSRDSTDANYAEYWANGTSWGKYDATKGVNGRIYISDKAAKEFDEWNYPFPEGAAPPPAGWVQFTITTEHASDFVNMTFAHEATHRRIEKVKDWGPNIRDLDTDSDGIPDDVEGMIPGMNAELSDSFGNRFQISHASEASRDAEFYCVLGGAFQFGDGVTGPAGAVPKTSYRGVVPEKSAKDNDWTENSENWKKGD